MKICPICKMTVNDNIECPFCQSTLTYEPTVSSEKEIYKLNKYLLLYFFRNCWFSLLCMTVVTINLIVLSFPLNALSVLSIFLLVCTLLVSLFCRKLVMLNKKYYTFKYSSFRINLLKIITGVISVILSLALWL